MKRKPRRHADRPPMPGPQRGSRSRHETQDASDAAPGTDRPQTKRSRAGQPALKQGLLKKGPFKKGRPKPDRPNQDRSNRDRPDRDRPDRDRPDRDRPDQERPRHGKPARDWSARDERRTGRAVTTPGLVDASSVRSSGRDAAPSAHRGGGPGWIYGTHAALAALANPARRIFRIVVASETLPDLSPRIAAQEAARGERLPLAQALSRDELDQLLPRGSVHQGVAVQASDLEPLDIDDLIRLIGDRPRVRLVALDQVTDPHNVGAILRSAAAFGVDAVILPERHAPAASAVMAKTASGALDKLPLVRVVNLARALDSLKAVNVWCIGLAGTAQQTIREADLTGRVALVLGSEGDGLRRLTRERCDLLVRIPMQGGGVESLNVSNAAAIALYEAFRGGASGG